MQTGRPSLSPRCPWFLGRPECDSQDAVAPKEWRVEGADTGKRFDEGDLKRADHAAAGWLSHEPPLLLRVLDFVSTSDMLAMSAACKAFAPASRFLAEREVRIPSTGAMLVFIGCLRCMSLRHHVPRVGPAVVLLQRLDIE